MRNDLQFPFDDVVKYKVENTQSERQFSVS